MIEDTSNIKDRTQINYFTSDCNFNSHFTIGIKFIAWHLIYKYTFLFTNPSCYCLCACMHLNLRSFIPYIFSVFIKALYIKHDNFYVMSTYPFITAFLWYNSFMLYLNSLIIFSHWSLCSDSMLVSRIQFRFFSSLFYFISILYI